MKDIVSRVSRGFAGVLKALPGLPAWIADAGRKCWRYPVLAAYRLLRLICLPLLPASFRDHAYTACRLAFGHYAFHMRWKLEERLPQVPRPTPDRPLRVFHGLYHTPQPVFISQEFGLRGLTSRYESLDRNPNFPLADRFVPMYHPDFYREHTVFRGDYPVRVNPAVTTGANLDQLESFFRERWEGYDVFQFNWFISMLPDNLDVEFLRRSGRPVYFHFHGCWVLENIVNEFTKRGQSAADACAHCKSMGWRDIYFSRFHRGVSQACRVFTSTPNLNHCSPDFEYLPNSLEPELESVEPIFGRKRPAGAPVVVVHAPQSEHVYEKKGTPEIMKAVRTLQAEGLNVQLTLIQNTPRDQAIVRYAEGDIFLDQLHAGFYGSAAIEAMALGLPVMSCCHPSHAHLAPGCPVVHVDPVTVTDRLRELVADGELRAELGRRCFEWRREFHSTRLVADHLLRLYREDLGWQERRPGNTLANREPYYGG